MSSVECIHLHMYKIVGNQDKYNTANDISGKS